MKSFRKRVEVSPKKDLVSLYTVRPERLVPTELLIQTVFTNDKLGVHLMRFHHPEAFANEEAAEVARILISEAVRRKLFPVSQKRFTVGRVIAMGGGANRFSLNELVYGWLPAGDFHICDQGQLRAFE